DQPPHGKNRQADPRDRPLQHVLHPRRPLRDRRGRAARQARPPRPGHPRAAAPGPRSPARRRPHGLVRRRQPTPREPPTPRAPTHAPPAPVVLHPPAPAAPQDVKLSPAGRIFYVADMHANALWKLTGTPLRVRSFLPTGRGVHGLYPSRNSRYLYASNRGEGSI